jgi:flagellar biosynthetic protein FlhB
MAEQFDEKSQDATPHRREEARREGQVAQSQDLGSAAILLGGMLVIMILGGAIVDFLANFTRRQLGGEGWDMSTGRLNGSFAQLKSLLFEVGGVLVPMLGAIMLVAVLAGLAQVGFLFVPKRLLPDISRISPLKGLKRLFSLTAVMRLIFGLFKIAVVTLVAFWSLYAKRNEIMGLAALELLPIGAFVMKTVLWTSIKIGAALFILALLDYMYQRWKQEQELKMSHQEVREEMKNMQGDPQVIARRRAVQRQLALNRLSAAVPKADVVVTNPTELAVAIQYEPEKMLAPIVLAKGQGIMAQRIRRLALENDIPIVERKPLAQALYKLVEIDHAVPDEQFAAVAEVLAYVYQLKGKPIPGAA